jgi:hypothetical protein
MSTESKGSNLGLIPRMAGIDDDLERVADLRLNVSEDLISPVLKEVNEFPPEEKGIGKNE